MKRECAAAATALLALLAVGTQLGTAPRPAKLLWATSRGGLPHRDGHELVPGGLARPRGFRATPRGALARAPRGPAPLSQLQARAPRDTETGERTVQKDPRKPLTPAKARWELARLAQVRQEGILDSVDYQDARAKIIAEEQDQEVRTRGEQNPQHLGTTLSAPAFKKGQALLAAMLKLKKDHAYLQKQLLSPWRQDKKGLKSKDKMLTRQMAKLEGAMRAMKNGHAQGSTTQSSRTGFDVESPAKREAQDFKAPTHAASSIPATQATPRFVRRPAIGSAAYTKAEVQRALGTNAVFMPGEMDTDSQDGD